MAQMTSSIASTLTEMSLGMITAKAAKIAKVRQDHPWFAFLHHMLFVCFMLSWPTSGPSG